MTMPPKPKRPDHDSITIGDFFSRHWILLAGSHRLDAARAACNVSVTVQFSSVPANDRAQRHDLFTEGASPDAPPPAISRRSNALLDACVPMKFTKGPRRARWPGRPDRDAMSQSRGWASSRRRRECSRLCGQKPEGRLPLDDQATDLFNV